MGLSAPITDAPDEIRAILAPIRHPFSVAVFAAGNAFAVGAIIRVAHSFLAREVILIGPEPHYEKASMGMEKYENVIRVTDEERFLELVDTRPLWAIEKDHATRSLYDNYDFPNDVVFLFGSERFGIPDSLIRQSNEVIGIPIYGVNHSLPLAVASGIVMNEWARRAYQHGALVR